MAIKSMLLQVFLLIKPTENVEDIKPPDSSSSKYPNLCVKLFDFHIKFWRGF